MFFLYGLVILTIDARWEGFEEESYVALWRGWQNCLSYQWGSAIGRTKVLLKYSGDAGPCYR